MYLKSIEIHGFKSFANKILFEFHDGITAIVGPNGSGKSNVADAVRWVLGEQSAKQLRGTSMQDVIFSGSEARKPLGYAYVSITFDNSDHKLPIAYEEVNVARRVYRSGESEYLINGNICRLRDVQEMFLDTGIGKEGYSIIGQGQIDKILSTKPEDRRELFDEAVGIVKFKKRKALSEKELEISRQNLLRINDIISEIETQLGPLEKQSEVAREYLKLKEKLKLLEVNQFLAEYEKSGGAKKALDEKYEIAIQDLESTQKSNENAETEYKKLEASIEDYDKALEEGRSYKSELLLAIEKHEGEIKLFEQQLLVINQNNERIADRKNAIANEINGRKNELVGFEAQKKNFDEKLLEIGNSQKLSNEKLLALKNEIEKLTKLVDDSNNEIFRLINDSGNVRTNIQRFETMLEQNNIRRTELNQRILFNKSEEADETEILKSLEEKLEEANARINEANEKCVLCNEELKTADTDGKKLIDIYEAAQQKYIGEKSRLDSLRNIAERYEGYGSSVKKIMEVKERYPGINGVVADLITVSKKYETAVEVALGASIQHIVTEDEQTAKNIIEYLKRNKLGRATFLPITSIGKSRHENDEQVMTEKGVIGDAASLVEADEKYAGVINHLLKNFIVVDNIDNALKLAAKYSYSLRIVTLEGEQLNPGGSIAGGSFRNASNLLGRKREIEELEKSISKLKLEIADIRGKQAAISEKKKEVRERIERLRRDLQDLHVEQNTAKMNLEAEKQKTAEIAAKYRSYENELKELEIKSAELRNAIEQKNTAINQNEEKNKLLNEQIESCSGRILELRIEEAKASEENAALRVEQANVEQAGQYTCDNISRINSEIEKLLEESKQINESCENATEERSGKENQIAENRRCIETDRKKVEELEKRIEELVSKKENIQKEHKSFFDAWAELGKRVNELEKETMRLQTQREKLAEQLDYQISYIWEEYQLTLSTAEEYRDDDFKAAGSRKEINDTKTAIKNLGNVNVNAIEDFKTISEKYRHMTTQRDDLQESEATILGIIEKLDEEMRKQFTEKFAEIKREFNTVFRDLFGGGKGELELIEDEDMLEAGIKIIAQPPGKKLQNMMQLSGGEKALTAIALLFAIQNLKPSPFCLLDEIEAALDDSNVKRFASYLKKLTKNSQFIVITHRRGTMAAADILYGITMQEKGVSTLVSVNLIENELDK